MCIVVTNKEKECRIIAFNRDELKIKKWGYPKEYWQNYKGISGYLDLESQGSWLVYNIYGIVCCVLNREMDYKEGNKSRSHIALDVLKGAHTIKKCLENWTNIDVLELKPFNLLIISFDELYYCSNRDQKGQRKKIIQKIESDFVILNRSYPNDENEPRISSNINRLKKLTNNDLQKWKNLMLESSYVNTQADEKTMSLESKKWKTLCHTIIKIYKGYKNNIECLTY